MLGLVLLVPCLIGMAVVLVGYALAFLWIAGLFFLPVGEALVLLRSFLCEWKMFAILTLLSRRVVMPVVSQLVAQKLADGTPPADQPPTLATP